MNSESLITDEILLDELSKRIEKYKSGLENLDNLNKQLIEVNKKLSESESLKSHFISNITNEIINPFASVLGLSKSIMNCDDPQKTQRMAQLIYREAFNLDFQFKNIFAAAEIEAGESVLKVSVVNIEELIKNLIDMYSHELNIKRIVPRIVNLTPDQAQVLFKTDSEKLNVILANLICNAINFNLPDKEIVISYQRTAENTLKIAVKDNGLGISKENQKKIFDRFHRLDSGINSINRGHGLGLSINKAYTDMLGGTLDVKSVENQGAQFTVEIPEIEMVSADYSDDGNDVFFGDDEIF